MVNQYLCTFFCQKLTNALLESMEGKGWLEKVFHNQYLPKNVAGPGGDQTCDLLITSDTHLSTPPRQLLQSVKKWRISANNLPEIKDKRLGQKSCAVTQIRMWHLIRVYTVLSLIQHTHQQTLKMHLFKFKWSGYKNDQTVYICLCWGFTAQSTQWGHVERGQFTQPHVYWAGLVL